MLKVRVIPTLLWKDVGLVKGVSFDSWRRIGTVMPALKVYNTRDVDELILVDISASIAGRTPDCQSVEDLAADCFVPFTVGGGIRDIKTIRDLLRVGADKVTINSGAYEDPELVTKGATRFGSQCIVASIDARRSENGRYECYSHSGSRPTGRELGAWAAELESLGAGEILVTSIDRDGTLSGYDLEMIETVTAKVTIPVIASGGAGSYDDMLHAITDAGASAVAAAAMFHFTHQTPAEAKKYLAANGIHVRDYHVAPR